LGIDLDLQSALETSKKIVGSAIDEYDPYAVVVMMSGGTDSLAAYYALRKLDIVPDFIIHGNTGTGIEETTHFVRRFAERENIRYAEGAAGTKFEDYVLRKGFFGRGVSAHSFAYHLLKADPLRKAISRNIRKGKRGRSILLINGARIAESENRKHNFTEPHNRDGKSQNIWVNVCHYWEKKHCMELLDNVDAPKNPVSACLNRSGECMCGTMQEPAARLEASMLFPAWGAWLDDLEARVMKKFPWGWNDNAPQWWISAEKHGQKTLPGFEPMCISCKG